MLIWELMGALVGAGFASGKEIASFFAQYGSWGYWGAAAAAMALVWFADTDVSLCWEGRAIASVWRFLLAALLTATGGAMLSAAGEVAALMVKMRHAYWMGILFTVLFAWYLAHYTLTGFSWVSKGMMFTFIVLLVVGLFMPRTDAAVLSQPQAVTAMIRGLCYGGFNAALLIPVVQAHHGDLCKPALKGAGLMTAALLAVGIAVFQRHPELLYEPLPFVGLMQPIGTLGYYLSGACLYLAVLSTLTACLRSLGKRYTALIGIVMISLLGFSHVIEYAYTILGGACCLMLLWAKFRNCSGRAFISRRDML